MTSLAFGDSLALRQHRLFESSDLEETRERIAAVMQPHRLVPLAAAPCRSHMDYLSIGGIGLGAIRLGAMRVEVPAVADYHLVVFCLAGRALVRTDDAELAVDDTVGVMCNPGEPFVATLSPDAEQFVLRLDRRRLSGYLGREAVFERRVDLRRPELRPLLWQMRALNADASLARLAEADARFATGLEAVLLGLLVDGQPQTRASAATVSPACVRRAEAFMRAQSSKPLGLDDIAAAAGVAPRTLQESFRRFRRTSPLAALRDLRLDGARAELGRSTASVSDVALRCGFTHFGRFALAYRQRFGEPPSAARARRMAG